MPGNVIPRNESDEGSDFTFLNDLLAVPVAQTVGIPFPGIVIQDG
jgi:hypothetical protein